VVRLQPPDGVDNVHRTLPHSHISGSPSRVFVSFGMTYVAGDQNDSIAGFFGEDGAPRLIQGIDVWCPGPESCPMFYQLALI